MPISANEFFSKGPVKVIGSEQQNLIAPIQDDSPNFFQRVWNQYKSSAHNILSDLDQASQKKMNPLSVGLQTAGEVAKSAFAPIAEIPGVKQAVGAVGKGAINAAAAVTDPLSGRSLKQDISDVTSQYDQWKAQHPEAAGNLEASVDIASLLLGNRGAQGVNKVAATGAEKVSELAAGGAEGTGKLLKTVGEKSYGVGVGMQESTKTALQAYQAKQPGLFGRVKGFLKGEAPTGAGPITEANTAARMGLGGTEWQLGVQAKKVQSDLWKSTIKPGLKGAKEKVNMKSFLSDVKKEIGSVADLNRRSTLMDAFNKFADDFKNVNDISYERLQKYKSGWAERVPEATYKGKPVAGALNEIRDIAAGKARTAIYDKLGSGAKQAYIDYGNLESIAKAGIKSVDLLRSKGFTKQVWEFVIDKAVTPVATVGGKVLYKTGEGLEFLGKKGAKKVKDIIGEPQTLKATSKKVR